MNRNALSNVLVYGSSSSGSESECEPEIRTQMRKRKISPSRDDEEDSKRQSKKMPDKCPPLELPAGILNMFSSNDTPKEDDSAQHHGRVRSFPHEQGNWATFVYIPVDLGENFQQLLSSLLRALPPNLEMQPVEDFHISLSRTVVIRHHWIDLFVESLRETFADNFSFKIIFERLEFYTNDEKTRSFLGLKISSGHDNLILLTNQVDAALAEFKLPPFYENPSFHMSIAWCTGDVGSKVRSDAMSSLQNTFDEMVHEDPSLQKVDVKELRCKTGNKLFSFWLGR